MNSLPPDNEESAELDALYRRISAADPSQPGEGIRHAVLEHATKLAARPAVEVGSLPAHSWHRPKNAAWRRPTAFGALAAAVLAVFMLRPQAPMQRQMAVPVRAAAEDRAAEGPAVVVADIAASPETRAAPPPAMAQAAVPPRQVTGSVLSRPPAALPPGEMGARDTLTAAAPSPQTRDAPARAGASGYLKGERDSANAAAAAPVTAVTTTTTAAVTNVPTQAKARADAGTRLWRAAESGDLGVLRELHEQHANLDLPDASGRTALMLATLHGHSQAVSVLLDAGADPNIPDASGESPLAAALAAHEGEIIAALKRHGAH
jgi:Ankyrin repeats (3 copies)